MNFSDLNTHFYLSNREQSAEPDNASYKVSVTKNGAMPLVLLLGLSGLAVLSMLMIFVVG